MKGKHPDIVHGPNADPHGQGPTRQPNEPDLRSCRGYPAGQIKRRISCEYRDYDRQGDETIVVKTDQNVHEFNPTRRWGLSPASNTLRYIIPKRWGPARNRTEC